MKKVLRVSHFVLLVGTLIHYLVTVVRLYAANDPSLTASPLESVEMLLTLGMLTFAAIYLVRDHQKNAALYYKIFLYVLAIATALSAIFTPFADGGVLLWLTALAAALLASVKNYGKTASFVTAALLIALRIALLVIGIVSDGGALVIGTDVCQILLALTVLVMVGEKYIDKAERGSK